MRCMSHIRILILDIAHATDPTINICQFINMWTNCRRERRQSPVMNCYQCSPVVGVVSHSGRHIKPLRRLAAAPLRGKACTRAMCTRARTQTREAALNRAGPEHGLAWGKLGDSPSPYKSPAPPPITVPWSLATQLGLPSSSPRPLAESRSVLLASQRTRPLLLSPPASQLSTSAPPPPPPQPVRLLLRLLR